MGLALVLLLALWCLRRRRNKLKAKTGDELSGRRPPPVPINSRPNMERQYSEMGARAQSPQMLDSSSPYRTPSDGSPPPQFASIASSPWPQRSPPPHSRDWTPSSTYYNTAQPGQQQYFVQPQQPQRYYSPPPVEMPESQSPLPTTNAYSMHSKGRHDREAEDGGAKYI